MYSLKLINKSNSYLEIDSFFYLIETTVYCLITYIQALKTRLIMKIVISLIIILLSSLTSSLSQNSNNKDCTAIKAEEQVYIKTDLPFYKPGETIWFSAWVVDRNIANLSKTSDFLNVELIAPDGNTLKKLKVLTIGGRGKGEFMLDTRQPGGIYKIKAYTQWMKNCTSPNYFEKDLFVQNTNFTTHLLNLEFNNKGYGAGEMVTANLSLKDPYNNIVQTKDPIQYTISIAGKDILSDSCIANNGSAQITFKLPKELNTNDAVLNVRINNEGKTESISRTVPINIEQIDLSFYPEGGHWLANTNSTIAFKALDKHNKPSDIEGVILDDDGTTICDFKSFHNGMGAFDIIGNKNKRYTAIITKPTGITTSYTLPEFSDSYYALKLEPTQNTIKADIFSTKSKSTITLKGYVKNICYFKKDYSIERGNNSIIIPTSDMPAGILRLSLYEGKTGYCERLIYINNNKTTKIIISPNKQSYNPHDEVTLDIVTTDENGVGIKTDLALAVADNKTIAFANDKQGDIIANLLLKSEVNGEIEDPAFYFDDSEEKANKALNYLLLTQGWRKFIIPDGKTKYPIEKAYIKGTLYDYDARPLPNHKIWIKGKNDTITTNKNGEFIFTDIVINDFLVLETKNNQNKIISKHVYSYSKHNLPNNIDEVPITRQLSVDEESLIDRAIIADEVLNTDEIIETGIDDDLELDQNIIEIEDTEVEVDSDLEIEFDSTLEENEEDENPVFFIVEEMPEYPGGDNELRKYITENTIYPRGAYKLGIQGRVYIQFVVDESGAITQVKIARGIHPALDSEAVRVVSQMPKWKPGKQRGKPVKVSYTVPINFVLDNTKLDTDDRPHDYHLYFQLLKSGDYYESREFYSHQYGSYNIGNKRNNLKSTIYWNPQIITNDNGKAQVKFYTTDNIGGFEISAEGISSNNYIGSGITHINTQLPMSIEAKVPTFMRVNDKGELPFTITNTTNENNKTHLSILCKRYNRNDNANDYLKITTDSIIEINAHSTKTIWFKYEALKAIKHLNIVATINDVKNRFNDRVSINTCIFENGFPQQLNFSSNNPDTTFVFDLEEHIPSTLNASFKAYPSQISALFDGLESIIREPHGCFEQTSAKAYPNLLVLDYLKSTNSSNVKAQNRALNLTRKAYKKLVNYETSENGFEWFGKAPAHKGLTAYALLEFTDMKKVYNGVDPELIDRTANWLLNLRDGKGGFYSRKHDRQFSRATEQVQNTYILYALSEANYHHINKEFKFAYKNALKLNDTYILALSLNTAINLNKLEEANILADILDKQIRNHGFGKLPAKESITRSRGHSLQVETASLYLLAQLKLNKTSGVNSQLCINYIAQSRKNGGFGSSQATIMALKALCSYAKLVDKETRSNSLLMKLNNKLYEMDYSSNTSVPIEFTNLQSTLNIGSNQCKVSFKDTNYTTPYNLIVNYRKETPANSENCILSLKTRMNADKYNLGDLARMTVSLKNKSDEVTPMAIAKIGIPSGLSLQSYQLKELVEKEKIDYYEVRNNYLVLYFSSLSLMQEINIPLYLKTEYKGIFKASASSAYLYYTNEHKQWLQGEQIYIY